jgi:hypothetical protein
MGARPTKEDRDALRLLLAREDLSDRAAEFVDSLRNQDWDWTPKQLAWFDDLCGKYMGG